MEKYKILRALNTKGTVHLAADNDGKKVVLKTLSPDSVSIYKRIAELPPHANSERVFECCEQDGDTVAVCEYIEGRTLHELLESGRTFPLKDIKRLICDLCGAVEHLHKNGIIHRDINPNNIMLDDKLKLKLIDHGIARLYSGKREQDTTILGTEGYSAPEQYGFKETRFTADVYSIGMVVKILLNSCENGSVPQEVQLRRIAAKCTAFDPDRRYKSAGAVRSAIKRSGYILPVAACCMVLAFAAAFAMGATVLLHESDSSDSSTPIQTTPSAATTAAAPATTSTAAPTTTATIPVTTPVTTTTPVISTSATTTAAATTTISTTQVTSTAATTTAATTTATAATTSTTKSTTTAAATTATTTASTPAFQPPEYLELFTLEGSDLNNPNRIEVTSLQDENGRFYDSFEYEFFDDPAVHGEWVYCNIWSLTGAKTPATAEGIINHEFHSESAFDGLTIYENGKAEIYYTKYNGEPSSTIWTNGYLISENGDGIFAERLFAVTIDDVEFLFMEHKSGDYAYGGEVNCYVIFVRKEFEAAQ